MPTASSTVFECHKGWRPLLGRLLEKLRQLQWTHHLMILGRAKRPEEREFYIRLSAREQWSSRELER
jgi:hypothetical protein